MAEIGKTKLPNAGEWWVQNDDGTIVYICGCDPDGDPVSMDDYATLHNSILRFFTQAYHHEPLCTGFDWLPVAEVWPKFIVADHWTDTAYVRRDSVDENSSYTIEGKKRENKNGKFSHAEPSIDSLIANKTWRYATEVEALARVQHPTLDPADISLNPVPGKVVATGTVKLTPVQPDDWVEFDPAQITCPRVGIDWLTPRLGESQWMPAMLAWSNATWAATRDNWKIRCRRCDLPVETSELDNMFAIIAEHTQQVRELTQRIGDLVQQVNERDAVIERIRTALRADFV